MTEPAAEPITELNDEELLAMFSAKKKKKAPKPKVAEESLGELEETYDELLAKIYVLMGQERDPLANRTKLKPPKTEKIGSKKTAWINFRQTCETLNRSEDHLSLFISSETGALVSITQDGALLIRGIFPSLKIESCLKKYMDLYVRCGMCKSTQTTLRKDPETRLMMMDCAFCKACRSVQAITVGFHATTKADRKKALTD
jgi:translation initiation factor 2 subunit 2